MSPALGTAERVRFASDRTCRRGGYITPVCLVLSSQPYDPPKPRSSATRIFWLLHLPGLASIPQGTATDRNSPQGIERARKGVEGFQACKRVPRAYASNSQRAKARAGVEYDSRTSVWYRLSSKARRARSQVLWQGVPPVKEPLSPAEGKELILVNTRAATVGNSEFIGRRRG